MESQIIHQHTFSDEQFAALLERFELARQREQEALSLADSLRQETMMLKAGLVHFDKQQVADMFACSVRQLERYEADGKLMPRRMLGKVLYPADRLLAFVHTYDLPEIGDRIRASTSPFPTRSRRQPVAP